MGFLLMLSPLSFRLEAKQVLNTNFGISVCLIHANTFTWQRI